MREELLSCRQSTRIYSFIFQPCLVHIARLLTFTRRRAYLWPVGARTNVVTHQNQRDWTVSVSPPAPSALRSTRFATKGLIASWIYNESARVCYFVSISMFTIEKETYNGPFALKVKRTLFDLSARVQHSVNVLYGERKIAPGRNRESYRVRRFSRASRGLRPGKDYSMFFAFRLFTVIHCS